MIQNNRLTTPLPVSSWASCVESRSLKSAVDCVGVSESQLVNVFCF